MNRKLIVRIVGLILCIEAGCMVLPFLVALADHGVDASAFAYAITICGIAGVALALVRPEKTRLQTRDGFVAVGLCWIALSVFGALPYFFAGAHYVDALFETASGLTTTGASIFPAPAALSRGILFWRALTQWMGGMGVLVMVLALLPTIGEGSVNLMKAESPGPISTKLRPKTKDTARLLYIMYLCLTGAETLCLRVAGMPWFDSLTTSFTTISTGGFSVRNESIAFYHSEVIAWIVIAFMFVSAINFSLLFLAVSGQVREALRSEELRTYAGITLGSVLLITLELALRGGEALYTALSHAAFQVVSIMTTTGFATTDFALWPRFSQSVLILLMFVGGCAGSTAGGVKVSRVVVLFKSLRRELQRILHSREVHPLSLDGRRVDEGTISSVSVFFFVYLLILLLCTAVVSLDNVPLATAFSAALTSISNVGPGLELVGPTCNFGFLSGLSKVTLSMAMLLGRLEILPLLMLFFPAAWRK